MGKRLDIEDIKNMLIGSALFAGGGGGSLKTALGMLDVLSLYNDHGLDQVELQSTAEYKAGASVFTDVIVGYEQFSDMGPAVGISDLISRLQERIISLYRAYVVDLDQQRFGYIMPMETGPYNVLFSVFIAATLKQHLNVELVLLDCDFAGRAVPCLDMAIPSINNDRMNIGPFHYCNLIGDDLIMDVMRDMDPGEIDRYLRKFLYEVKEPAVLGYGWYTNNAALLQEYAVYGTISRAMKLGEIITGTGENKMDKIFEYLRRGGDLPLSGSETEAFYVINDAVLDNFECTTCKQRDDTGYNYLHYRLRDKNNHQVTLICMNENLFVWDNDTGRPLVMGPDLICLLDGNGMPIIWEDLKSVKSHITVIGVKAHNKLRRPEITSCFIEAINKALSVTGLQDSIIPVEKYLPVEELAGSIKGGS